MTPDEIEEYITAINKDVYLFGYTSTSLNEGLALGFAWENSETKHQKVMFHIVWSSQWDHYFLNAGAYDHEEEVVLMDGTRV